MQNILHVDGHVFPGIRQLEVGRPGHPRIDRRIRAVVEHLHANLCMRISVADLARSVNMSRWHFCHLFKTEMSQSPIALYADLENARGTEDVVGNVLNRERD